MSLLNARDLTDLQWAILDALIPEPPCRNMREEILAIERSLERIQDAKLEEGKDGSGKDGL